MDEALISIGLSPNTLADDVALARSVFLHPTRWYDTKSLHALQAKLAHSLGHPLTHTFLSISGRSSLHSILSAIGVTKGDEVLMQAFNCVAVSNSIQWLGATPVYVDIEKDTLNMDFEDAKRKVSSNTKAIIVQHTFGLPVAYMSELIEWAHQKNIYVIGDCAHALGATFQQRSITEYGDFTFISFGRDKVISSVFGGALFVNEDVEPSILKRITDEFSSKHSVSRSWLRSQLLHPILTHSILQTYDIFKIGQILSATFASLGLLSKATSLEEKKSGSRPEWTSAAYPGGLAELALHQFGKMKEMNLHRAAVAKQYLLAQIPSVQKLQSHHLDRVWLRYPVLVADPKKAQRQFRAHRIIIGDWYDQVVGPASVDLTKAGYQMGTAPLAEDVAAHIINLPVHPRMPLHRTEEVIAVFKDKVELYGN